MTMNDNPMTGLWELVSYIVRQADGRETVPLGADAVGYLYYSPDGVVSGIMMERNRPHFQTGNRLGASVEEKVRGWDSAITYMGTYEFLGDRVMHRIKASVFPDWSGANQLRYRRVLASGNVELTAQLEERGVKREAIVTWRRIDAEQMRAP